MLLIYILIPSLTLTLALAIFLYFRLRKDSLAAYQKLHQTILLLKMENIRTRISPHFFFNALSTLSAETADPETTHRNIKMLLLLLRKSVDNAEQLAIPLADELELVKGYNQFARRKGPRTLYRQL